VSSGRVKVPQVAGATEEEARQRLAAAGITVSRVEAVYSDYYEAGMVTGSSPKAGMTLGWGEGVVLTVAAGRASCPQCGSRREAGARFCTRCGHKY
jgi:serine/threonine-protein kinase